MFNDEFKDAVGSFKSEAQAVEWVHDWIGSDLQIAWHNGTWHEFPSEEQLVGRMDSGVEIEEAFGMLACGTALTTIPTSFSETTMESCIVCSTNNISLALDFIDRARLMWIQR